jgi:hypothetical protein
MQPSVFELLFIIFSFFKRLFKKKLIFWKIVSWFLDNDEVLPTIYYDPENLNQSKFIKEKADILVPPGQEKAEYRRTGRPFRTGK